MHSPSATYLYPFTDFTSFVTWIGVFVAILVAALALRMFQRAFGDQKKQDLARLNKRYKAGLMSFEQYQREKDKILRAN